MKLTFRSEEDLQAELYREYRKGERAVTRAVEQAGRAVKRNWRRQIRAAQFGGRLANTIRARRYPEHTVSMNAAALVWSKAPEILSAHERGALIRSQDGFWLAIPTRDALRGTGGNRITPGEWERKNNRRLQFVYPEKWLRRLAGPRHAVLMDIGGAPLRERIMTKKGLHRKAPRVRKRAIIMFVLVPQVRLKKRLDLMREAEAVAASIPSAIARKWR